MGHFCRLPGGTTVVEVRGQASDVKQYLRQHLLSGDSAWPAPVPCIPYRRPGSLPCVTPLLVGLATPLEHGCSCHNPSYLGYVGKKRVYPERVRTD